MNEKKQLKENETKMLFPACYYNVSDVVWKEDWILNKTSPLLGRYIDTMMILEFAISTSCEDEIANSSNKIIHEKKNQHVLSLS